MPIRDKGPIFQLGYGVNSRQHLRLDGQEVDGANPAEGPLAKALDDNPVMRFLASSAVAMTGMVVAGAVLRKGGVKLGVKLQEMGAFSDETIKGIRKVQHTLDQWQGLTREFADGGNYQTSKSVFGVRGNDGRVLKDNLIDNNSGFFFSLEEKREAARIAKRTGGLAKSTQEWTARDEIQKRLIGQARRLQYEIPAAYVAQKGIAEPLLGSSEDKVNWKNPVDVFTDFVTESTKLLAFAIMPFETGTAAGKQGIRKLMTYSDDLGSPIAHKAKMANFSVSLKSMLERLGTDSADLLGQTAQYSSRATGSLATGIDAARQHAVNPAFLRHQRRHGATMFSATKIHSDMLKVPGGFIDKQVLDTLPGPLRGLGTGIKAAQGKWRDVAAEQEAFNSMMSHGLNYFEAHTAKNVSSAVKASKYETMGDALKGSRQVGSHQILSFAAALQNLGKGGIGSSAWRNSEFYRGQMQNEYQKLLRQRLISQGLDDELSHRIATETRFRPPVSSREPTHISNRGKLGSSGKVYAETDDDFFDQIRSRLDLDDQTYTKVRSALPKAVDESDLIFVDSTYKRYVESKISSEWDHLYNVVAPRVVGEQIDKMAMPYQAFDVIGQKELDFMIQATAKKTGLNMVDEFGNPASRDQILAHLNKKGFGTMFPADNPADALQMKAFLINNRVISKPWTSSGRNVFGMRQLSVSEGYARGYFKGGDHSESEVRHIISRITRDDPVALSQHKLGGVYETSSGTILDFSLMKRRAVDFYDTVAQELKIPFINIKPFDILGAAAGRDARARASMEYVPSMSSRAFLPKTSADDSFYMLAHPKAGRAGDAYAFKTDRLGLIQSRKLEGKYKPLATDGSSLVSRHAGMAVSERPASSVSTSKASWFDRFIDNKFGKYVEKPSQSVRDALDIAPNQRSIWNLISRFRTRDSDIRNPVVFSKLMRDGEVQTRRGKLIYDRSSNQVFREGESAALYNSSQVSEAFDAFASRAKSYGVSPKIGRSLDDSEVFDGVFTYNLGKVAPGVQPSTFSLVDGKIRISDLETPEQLAEAARLIRRHDIELAKTVSRSTHTKTKAAQESLLGQHINEASSAEYWSRSVTGPSSSINTRIDQLRSDLYKYMGMREGLLGGNFAETSTKLVGHLDEMKSAGRITPKEYTEAKAAIFSMQIGLSSYSSYSKSVSTIGNVRQQIMGLLDGDSQIKSMLDDFASGKVGNAKSTFQGIRTRLNERFGVAPFNRDTAGRSPFGSEETVFAPTFGTAFQRDPIAATASVFGLNTWSNPQAWSTKSVPVSHLFGRLNEYGETLGMAINASSYKGPLDFYARGVIGKRVFPIVAGATGLVAADRTLGGLVNEKDQYGDRVYSPFVIGKIGDIAVEAQAAFSFMPGGKTYKERSDELKYGEVAVRSGRFWPLGNTPFRGGKVQYYRPSWYRRLKSGHLYTDQTYGSPVERLAYGYDFSPLRPFDPYRFEREHYSDRPYPVTGAYFTGPWGPLTSVLNMTVGKILKPQRTMHEDELNEGLRQYAPVGDSGAYFNDGQVGGYGSVTGGYGGAAPGSEVYGGAIGAGNRSLGNAGKVSIGRGARATRAMIGANNNIYMQNAQVRNSMSGYNQGVQHNIVPAAPPAMPGSLKSQSSQLGYELQELFGIYGFGAGALRSGLGFGNQDMTLDKPVLGSADSAYGSTRGFWGLNLGGIGDVPGQGVNIQLSEIMRRFVPKQRSGIETINPIKNDMGIMYPWLPGSDYFTDFTRGDPYTKIQEGEMRLPGQGYERFHTLHRDASGKYGIVDRHKILGDIAPWSQEYRDLDRTVESMAMPMQWRDIVETTRSQVASKSRVKDFYDYKYKYSSAKELGISHAQYAVGRVKEFVEHSDTYFNTKFLHHRTAVEDWEREHVYGATFPEWQHPIKGFINPMINKNTQTNPITATATTGLVGSLFASTSRGRTVGGIVGGAVGLGSSLYGKIAETLTGERFIPKERRRQGALEEYIDILTYVKNLKLSGQARAAGDTQSAEMFKQQAQRTMYGANTYDMNLGNIIASVPKRKRDHFREMLFVDKKERERVLSTAPRLERRLFQAAWGMDVEARPELQEYFSKRELPDDNWEGWSQSVSMDHIKIKAGQSLGIDLSEMGYYPQQIKEANLINPSYPDFTTGSLDNANGVTQRIRRLLRMHGGNGDVTPIYTPYSSGGVEISMGV